jgi:RNA polymerase sigma-70 factor, ECF subfamily
MNGSSQLDELAKKLRAGEDSALELMFQQFAERLISLARNRIATYYRNKVDAEDVVQSVFKSFLKRYRDEKLQINSGESLWGLLTIITVRKCADRIEHLRAACRNVRREVFFSSKQSTDLGSIRHILDREPAPEEAVELAECVDQLFRGLDPDDCIIVEMQLQGFSATETASMLNRSERTVRRIRARVRNRLLKMLEVEFDIGTASDSELDAETGTENSNPSIDQTS